MTCLFFGWIHCPLHIIIIFKISFSCDSMIFNTCVYTNSIFCYIRFYIFIICIITNITIEFSIIKISRITTNRTPYLFRTFNVSSKCNNTFRWNYWSKSSINRSRVCIKDSVWFCNNIDINIAPAIIKAFDAFSISFPPLFLNIISSLYCFSMKIM